jgi:hypothetical protein
MIQQHAGNQARGSDETSDCSDSGTFNAGPVYDSWRIARTSSCGDRPLCTQHFQLGRRSARAGQPPPVSRLKYLPGSGHS